MSAAAGDNAWIAQCLREMADLLDTQAGNPYRAAAQAGKLPTLAPRRFNAQAQAWLPVLHTQHGDWHFTALFSNTARAHELGRVHDWVVIHGEDPTHGERQYTVVTALRGPLAGRRAVRGREAECQAWYAQHGAEAARARRSASGGDGLRRAG